MPPVGIPRAPEWMSVPISTRPVTALNGWAANAHVGDYEGGVNQGHQDPLGLNNDVTDPYNNPANAMDSNESTAASVAYTSTHRYAGCVWDFSTLAAATDLLTNGGFETGDATGWTAGGDFTPAVEALNPFLLSGAPHSGSYFASLVASGFGSSILDQQVTIPSGAGYAVLTFWRRFLNGFTSTGWQGGYYNGWFRVTVQDTAGTELTELLYVDSGEGTVNTVGWIQASFDLSAFKGSTVVLHFECHRTGGIEDTLCDLDDVALTFSPFPARSAKLRILSEVPSGSGTRLRDAGVWYSLDGGSNWTKIYQATLRTKQWDIVVIPDNTDLSQLQVMAFTDSHDNMAHNVHEIYVESVAGNDILEFKFPVQYKLPEILYHFQTPPGADMAIPFKMPVDLMGALVTAGAGSPEGIISANPGSLYLRMDTGKLYVKESGTGNIGWVAK
jgi:hypothetical protein